MYSSNTNHYEKSPLPSASPPPPPYANGQPTANGMPVQYSNTPAAWSTGLFDCFSDIPNCCITCWCPCITFEQIVKIVDKGETITGTSGVLHGLLSIIIGCGGIYSRIYRRKMREQFMLEESPCGDCLVHCCCEPCALCQEHRELRIRGFDMSFGWQENVERQNGGVAMPPKPQGGMTR